MKWFHLSDIHFITNCKGGNTRLLLDNLLDYLREENLRAEELFITGDFRYAKTQKERKNQPLARIVAAYIWEVATQLGITDEKHIHLVPGNHDLNRKKELRENNVRGIYPRYSQKIMDGDLDEAVLNSAEIKHLVSAFTFYKAVLENLYSSERTQKIWAAMQRNIHYYDVECNPYFNIFCMNTAIMSVEESEAEKGKLVVSHTHVHKALCEMIAANPTDHKPVIVLAHHPLEHLHYSEQAQLKKYFYDCGVYVYLSGHSHETRCSTKNGNYMFVTQGSLRTEKGAQIGFSIGKYTPPTKEIRVESYEYRDGSWGKNLHFGNTGGDKLTIRERKPNPNGANLRIALSRIDKGFEKSTDDAERDIIVSLAEKGKASAINYLLGGLSYSDFWSDKMTAQLFFNNFFIPPHKAEDDIISTRIGELFADARHNILCLKGEAGSGKSTFIRLMAIRGLEDTPRALYYRCHVLDCSETKGPIPKPFPCESIKKHIQNELEKMNLASKNNGALWENYLKKVLLHIIGLRDTNCITDDCLNEFINYISYANQQIMKYSEGVLRYAMIAKTIAGESIAREYEPWTQLALLLLILTCKNCLFEKDERRRHIIVFDNIEVYTDHIAIPVPESFYNANISMKRLFAFLNERNVFSMSDFSVPVVKPDFMSDFTFVICARFTTKLRTVHDGQKIYGENDRYIVERKFYDFTVEALLSKLAFLKKRVPKNTELIGEVEGIISLLITKGCVTRHVEGKKARGLEQDEENDIKEYSKLKYLPLFNNDFRKAIRELEAMYKKRYGNFTWMEYALSFPQSDYSDIGKIRINASRMVLLKNIIDSYVTLGFLDTIGFESNISNGSKSCSITRMILSLLYWRWKEQESTYLTVGDVVKFFELSSYDRGDVIAALTKLSLHVEENDEAKAKLISGWGYFVDILECEDADIKSSLANPSNDAKTTVKLTPGGLCMAQYVTLQFEFFNARIPDSNKIPLVLYDDYFDGMKFAFEKRLDAVFSSVVDFVDGLLDNIVVPDCDHSHLYCQTFIRLNELFDVVMDHIFYIDRARMLKWATRHSPTTNKIFLQFIKKYFELFDKIEESSILPDKCKKASIGLMLSRDSRTIDYKGISIDKEKLRCFLQEKTGGIWELKSESLFEHLKGMK